MFHKADLNKVPTGATSLSEDGRKENISSILQAALNLSHSKRTFYCSLAKGGWCAYLGLEKSGKPLQCIELCCIWRAVDKHTLLVRLRLLRRSWVLPPFGPVCFVLLHITDCTLHPGQPITRGPKSITQRFYQWLLLESPTNLFKEYIVSIYLSPD